MRRQCFCQKNNFYMLLLNVIFACYSYYNLIFHVLLYENIVLFDVKSLLWITRWEKETGPDIRKTARMESG